MLYPPQVEAALGGFHVQGKNLHFNSIKYICAGDVSAFLTTVKPRVTVILIGHIAKDF